MEKWGMKITSFEILEEDFTLKNFTLKRYISGKFNPGVSIMIPEDTTTYEKLNLGFKLLCTDRLLSTLWKVHSYTYFLDSGQFEIPSRCKGVVRWFHSDTQREKAYYMTKPKREIDQGWYPAPMVYCDSDLDAFCVFRHTSSSDPYTLSSKSDEVEVRVSDKDGRTDFTISYEDFEVWSWLCGVSSGSKRGMCIFVDSTISDLICRESVGIGFFDSLDEFCLERGIQMILLTQNGMMRVRKDIKKYMVGLDKAV